MEEKATEMSFFLLTKHISNANINVNIGETMGLSKNIKKAMIEKDIKVGELAERLGDDPRVVTVTLCRDTFSYRVAERYARQLGCDIVLRDRETGQTF